MGTSVETVIFVPSASLRGCFTDDCLFLLEYETATPELIFCASVLLRLYGRMGIRVAVHESLSCQPGV